MWVIWLSRDWEERKEGGSGGGGGREEGYLFGREICSTRKDILARARETRNVPEPSTRLVILRNPPTPSVGRVRAARVRMTITLVKNKENCGGRILYLSHPYMTRFFMLFIFSISLARKKQFSLRNRVRCLRTGRVSLFYRLACDYNSKE